VRYSMTLYGGATDPKPLAEEDFDWPEVCLTLRELVEREHPKGMQKKHMMAWGPHKLILPHRLLPNVKYVSMHVLDVDSGNVHALARAVKRHSLAAILYGSPSDDEEGPEDERRLRVVIPASRRIKVEESRRVRFQVAEHLGLRKGCGVSGAKDASRIFFAGRMHGTAPRYWETFKGEAL